MVGRLVSNQAMDGPGPQHLQCVPVLAQLPTWCAHQRERASWRNSKMIRNCLRGAEERLVQRDGGEGGAQSTAYVHMAWHVQHGAMSKCNKHGNRPI